MESKPRLWKAILDYWKVTLGCMESNPCVLIYSIFGSAIYGSSSIYGSTSRRMILGGSCMYRPFLKAIISFLVSSYFLFLVTSI